MGKKTIKLNNLIYSSNQIKKAINDFSEVCSVSLLDDKYTLEFGGADLGDIDKEFSNYVLGLMNNG